MRGLLRLRSLIEHPWFQMLLGLVLLATGLDETMDSFEEASFSPGAHHGVVALGAVHFLKSIPDVIEGFIKATSAVD